jgi:two-component system response regulator MprA
VHARKYELRATVFPIVLLAVIAGGCGTVRTVREVPRRRCDLIEAEGLERLSWSGASRCLADGPSRATRVKPYPSRDTPLRSHRTGVAGGLAGVGYPRSVNPAVLVVDDDAPIRRMLERTFAAEGYSVAGVSDGGAALAAIERATPDLIVLDIGLPGIDGLTVCRRLRGKGLGLPILLLTARDAVRERVAGLDAGADDYLAKPFAPEELLARARALLRRGTEPVEVLSFDDLDLDVAARTAHRSGRTIELSRREAELLELLLRNPRRVVSRELALERIWGSSHAASLNAVDRYVSYLRRKLGDPPLIETVRGVGFVLGR